MQTNGFCPFLPSIHHGTLNKEDLIRRIRSNRPQIQFYPFSSGRNPLPAPFRSGRDETNQTSRYRGKAPYQCNKFPSSLVNNRTNTVSHHRTSHICTGIHHSRDRRHRTCPDKIRREQRNQHQIDPVHESGHQCKKNDRKDRIDIRENRQQHRRDTCCEEKHR